MKILAIDPGTDKSGYVVLENGRVECSRGEEDNAAILCDLRYMDLRYVVACEMVAHYGSGMAVGREVFETVEWIGRFREAWESRTGTFLRVYRKEVTLHLCGSGRAKDGNVRQAILDLYGGKEAAMGKKAKPGPLYGVSGHAWQALAVGLTAQHQLTIREKEAV